MSSFEQLIKIYTNEKATRDLLPYDPIIETFYDYLSQKSYELESDSVLRSLLELEFNRVNFFIKEYLLIRLNKIRHFCKCNEANMTEKELSFSRKYSQLPIFKKIQTNDRSLEYVGFICLRAVNSVILDNEVIDLKQGYFYIARLDQIYAELIKGTISLV